MGLSKEILLTVKDYEVKLNKDIKFYENDTIDLCFSILEYGIEVKDGVAVNKLMPINALKAYMLIETPQGVDYAESTKVEDNRVVFNLGDKYSQFVGIGKMQIVIKDNDGCRITLPEFPFEIRQSINSDWDRNITVLSTEASEIIIDEFGREIALKKISEMEETNTLPIDSYSMILDNNENKKIKTNLITQKIENDLQLINEQLDTMQNIKRNKTDLIKSNELDISSDTYKIKKNNLSEEVLAMLTPNANITIGGVVDNLSLVKEKYAINSIGVNQVDFLNTVNLINPNNMTKGYFINAVTGNLQENANYNATDFIPVRQGDTLSQYLLWRTFFAFYDKDMNFIGNGGITELTDVFTVPNNAYFARFTTKDLSPTLIKSNTQITVKIPYEVQLSKDINLLKSIKDKSITKNLIDDEIAKISLGKNLFNKNTIEIDKYITTNGGISSATDWYLSDFIKVEGNKSINLSYGHNCNEYDENKNLIKTNSSLKTFTTMSNTRYIRFSCKNTYKLPSEFQVEYGNTETSYENYCYKINDNINGVPLIIGNSSSVNDYKGMDIISFGDSTVFQNKWQPKLMSYLQLGNHTNGGVSGSRISGNYQYHNAMWTDERLATLPNSEFNGLLFLLGGINDWAQNVPLGDITSKNTDEFYGALNVLIPKLIQKYPKAKIVLLSTTWCFMPDRDMFDDKTGLINNLGLMSVDYGQAILKIAKRYGLKSIDLSGLGWNNYNYTDYIPDRVHFNDLGGDLVAKEIAKGI